MKTINTIVGRSDYNLSGAIDSLSDIQIRLTTTNNNDDEYLLVPENENKKNRKNLLLRKSSMNNELERQTSSIHRRIDLFQVKEIAEFEKDFQLKN
jgi:hypothetical protein